MVFSLSPLTEKMYNLYGIVLEDDWNPDTLLSPNYVSVVNRQAPNFFPQPLSSSIDLIECNLCHGPRQIFLATATSSKYREYDRHPKLTAYRLLLISLALAIWDI